MKFKLIERAEVESFLLDNGDKFPHSLTMFQKCPESIGADTYWFRIEDGQPFCVFGIWFDHLLPNTIHLFSIEVVEAKRGQFLGTQAVSFVNTISRSMSMLGVTTFPATMSHAAYYEKLGFQPHSHDGVDFHFQQNATA